MKIGDRVKILKGKSVPEHLWEGYTGTVYCEESIKVEALPYDFVVKVDLLPKESNNGQFDYIPFFLDELEVIE